MTDQRESLVRLQKDNLTNIRNQNEIDSYFSFLNPDSKKRHSQFLTIEILNFLIIIFGLIIFPITNISKFTWISVFTGLLIISIVLFRYKKPSYRILSYLIDIFGVISVLFIPIYGNFSFVSNIEFSDVIIDVVQVIIIIVDVIFLLNYITIENARQRFMSPLVRSNKLRNQYHMGDDKWEDM